ncbi:hypothetical protein J504_0412 [Acinetobacter baumannii 348935]|nr:hypothetical protein J504_0412 [Acinetobacter baumannii 348935]
MLKLVSNKDGVEVHQLTIADNEVSITPAFNGITELLSGITDKQQILNALSGFNPDYVWAVTHESPSLPILTRRQFMRTLVLNQFDLDDIEAKIRTIEDAQERQLALIDWHDATEFERNNQTMIMMIDLLGLTNDQVDALWSQALTL